MMIAGKNPWLRHFAALFICGGLYLGFVSAQEDAKEKQDPPAKLWKLPAVLEQNRAPTSVEELREIEKHVQKVLEKVRPSVVSVQVGFGQGSGVIISEDGTILTAGHVSGNPKQNATVTFHPKKTLKGKTLGKNGGIDSGMMKIAVEGKYPALEMGHSADLKVGQWVIAVGHPGGFRDNRGPVVRVGRILFVNAFVIRTDCTLVGGDSGGPLFDMQGRVIGIHSRIGGAQITENMHVPIDTFRETYAKLAAGESFGGQLGQQPTVLSLGGKLILEKKDALNKNDPTQPAPADATQKSYKKTYTVPFKAGHSYTIDLVSSDSTGTKLDTYLRLENPEGKEVAHDDDGGGFPHARLVYRAPSDGDYKVIATSFAPNQTGRFTLSVHEAQLESGKIDVLRASRIPAPVLEKLFETLAKGKATLQINAILVNDKGDRLADKEVTFAWDSGKQSVKSNAEGFARFALEKGKTRKLNLDLPEGVRAMFLVTDQNGNNVPLFSGPNDPSIEKVKSAGGKVVKTFDGKLTKTDPFDLERDKCYHHVREFKMVPGKTYTLDLVSEDFDAYLRIEHDDKKLAEDDDGAGFMNSRIVFTPETEETFRLIVTTCDPGQSGAYRLTIRETTAKPAEPKNGENK
jgi:V8-like Glu-specific endopeptidase